MEGLTPYGSQDELTKYNKIWGLTTGERVKVKLITNSPNYWGDYNEGNKHVFFILEGCANPDSVKGLHNEFMRSDLRTHRKVIDGLSHVVTVEPVADQLSGVGFSSTIKNHFNVYVEGEKSGHYKVEVV